MPEDKELQEVYDLMDAKRSASEAGDPDDTGGSRLRGLMLGNRAGGQTQPKAYLRDGTPLNDNQIENLNPEKVEKDPGFYNELTSAAISSAPALGNPPLFGGAVLGNMFMNSFVAKPNQSELNAESTAGIAELLLSKTAPGKALAVAKGVKGFLGRMGVQAGLVGLEQAGEAALGFQSKERALANTLTFGVFPSSMAEGFRATAAKLLPDADPDLLISLNINDPRELQKLGLSAYANVFTSANNFVNELSLVNNKVGRDQYLTAAAFGVLDEFGLLGDVAVSKFTARAGERSIPDIQRVVRRAVYKKHYFDDLIRTKDGTMRRASKTEGGLVKRRLVGKSGKKSGDILVPDGKGGFKVGASATGLKAERDAAFLAGGFEPTRKQVRAARDFAQADPGGMAQLFAKDNTKIDSQIVPTMEFLQPEDRARVMNAYLSETVIGPSLFDSVKGVDPNTIRKALKGEKTSLTRNQLDELLIIDAQTLKGKLSTHNQKLTAILGEGTDLAMGTERLNRLNRLADVLVKHEVKLHDFARLSKTEVYAGNRVVFNSLANNAQFGFLGGMFDSTMMVAQATGIAITAGKAISWALNDPKLLNLLVDAADGNTKTLPVLLRALQSKGYKLEIGDDGIANLIDPSKPQAAERTPEGLSSEATLQPRLLQKPGRPTPPPPGSFLSP